MLFYHRIINIHTHIACALVCLHTFCMVHSKRIKNGVQVNEIEIYFKFILRK